MHPLAEWSDFFVAQTGAAAALTGLVIVAISINLKTILENRLLPGRAAETVLLLAGVLLLSTFGLVPGQPLWLFGAESLAIGLGEGLVGGIILYKVRDLYHPQEMRWLRLFFGLGAALPFAVAGGLLLGGVESGLYWLVPGVVLSLVGGIVNSWVLLVEILR